MPEPIMWDGRITDIQTDHREKRLELFRFAKSDQWDQVLAFLSVPDNAEFLNILEPDNPAFTTLLHDAVLTNADPAVVGQLVNMGAWRARRNANYQTPLDIAREKGHSQFYDVLAPVLKMSAPLETLQQLEHHFHDLIRSHRDSGAVVSEQALQLPQLATQLEIDGHLMYFLIPGMWGGYNYRLDDKDAELVLYTHVGSRMDGPNEGQIHKITSSGIELVAQGKEIDKEELFPLVGFIIFGFKRKH